MNIARYWGVSCGWYQRNPRALPDMSRVAHVEVTRCYTKAMEVFLAWQATAQYDYVVLHAPTEDPRW